MSAHGKHRKQKQHIRRVRRASHAKRKPWDVYTVIAQLTVAGLVALLIGLAHTSVATAQTTASKITAVPTSYVTQLRKAELHRAQVVQAEVKVDLGITSAAPMAATTPTQAEATSSSGVELTMAAVSQTTLDNWRMAAFWWARAQHGKPYIWGGTGPYGFDCSGLVFAAYRHIGVSIPRTTYGMLASIGWKLKRVWSPVKGDLAFYGPGHVEFWVKPGWTWGAEEPGTVVSFHHYSSWWHPTMYYEVI